MAAAAIAVRASSAVSACLRRAATPSAAVSASVAAAPSPRPLLQSGVEPAALTCAASASGRPSAAPAWPSASGRCARRAVVVRAAGDEADVVVEEEGEYAGNDDLLLYFKAEGVLSEPAIPRVAKALEAVEGVENVRVQVLEGCATAECTMNTTVQATGVASSLVEAITGAGFALQTVSLGFDDEGVASPADLFSVYASADGEGVVNEAVAA